MSVLKIRDQTIQPKVCAFFMECSSSNLFQTIRAHSVRMHLNLVILHSEKCYTILMGEDHSILAAYNHADFELIRQYMYTGEMDIPEEKALKLNDLATTLRLESLMKAIASEIKFGNYSEMFATLQKATETNNPYMEAAILKKLCESFDTIDFDILFQNIHVLTPDMMEQVLQCEKAHTNAKAEFDLALLLSKWSSSSVHVSPTLKAHIKFELIPPHDLITKVKPLQILTDAEYTALLEKMLMGSKSSKKKFYICNVQNKSIPDGYRTITNEEFHTDEFKQQFLKQLKEGFECIETFNEKNNFLVTASQDTIMYSGSYIHITLKNSIHMVNASESKTSIFNLGISMTSGKSVNDAYVCVKK